MGDLAIYTQTLDVRDVASLRFEPARSGVASWNTYAAEGAIAFRLLRAHAADTTWLPLAEWTRTGRRSFGAERDGVRVDVDTIHADRPFDGIELRADGVEFSLVAFSSPFRAEPSLPYAGAARILDVPIRSQYALEGERGWCSPASVTMIAAYHGIDIALEEAAAAVFDRSYNGTGNWSFNVALAGSLGLRASVAHLRNLDHALRLIERNVPIAISYSWAEGELPNAPLVRSDGHLAVLCGFTQSGDCAINDPAAAGVRCVYPRAAIERIWQRNGGVAYAIAPAGIDVESVLATA